MTIVDRLSTLEGADLLFGGSSPSDSLLIGGEWRAADSVVEFDVTDPATGAVIAAVADGGAAEARAAISAAASARKAWASTTAYERAAVLDRAHRIMRERAEALAQLMTLEQGKPLRAARLEVAYAADFLSWFAEEAKRNYGRTIPSARADQRFLVQQRPVGVVAAITPWNYPISMITRKLGPALAAGCPVVLKPASETPLCAIATMRILQEAGAPAGVVNLVTGRAAAAIGEEFVSHHDVAKITFTGSTRVGKTLAAAAAGRLKRVSMELGGHAPFIVFDDADPVHAAKGAAAIKMLNTGQACIVPNRYFVHRSLVELFTQTLVGRLSGLRIGSGFEEGVTVGPLISETAVDRMQAQVDDAVAKGATVLAGGSRPDDRALAGGHFYPPTVLAGVSADMVIYREETFGPIAPVIVFDSEDEVIQMANDTSYGLASYVYTRDIARAFRVSEQLEFGIVGINDINPTSAAAPFGGMKESGFGREGAIEGLTEYLETQLVGLSV
ncbi:MAG: NAD-dependent succinate-semialdehyde dehydrogenase [Microbacterium sp.]